MIDGCGSATQTVWSVEAKSSDGQWMATAKTDQTSGPGNAFVYTDVALKHVTHSDPPVTLLGFSSETVLDSNARPTLEWITPRHLQISFLRTPVLDTQVVRYAGIEITVRESEARVRDGK